jgi:hypothetical protein
MRVTIVLKSGFNMNGNMVNDNFKSFINGWENQKFIALQEEDSINAIILTSEIASILRQKEG